MSQKTRVGDRVEVRGGRSGTVRRRVRILHLLPAWEVWCDEPDFLGRHIIKVIGRDINHIETAND